MAAEGDVPRSAGEQMSAVDRPRTERRRLFWKQEALVGISSESETEKLLESSASDGVQPHRPSTSERRPSSFEESFQSVWSPLEIAASLRAMPGGETLWSALAEGSVEEGAEGPALNEALSKGNGGTALLICAWCGRTDLLERLLEEEGVSANAEDVEGRTPLHLACFAGNEKSASLLLAHGAKTDVWDGEGKATPVHCAACAGSGRCLELLADAGADVDAGITEGRAPMYYAVQVNSAECVRVLLSRGATVDPPRALAETPLHVAAALGFSACIQRLLEGGADVSSKSGRSEATALHLAAQVENADCARLLLEAGADARSSNRRRQTPLHMAALAQSTETLELLLGRGVDPNAVDADLRTPLHCAIVKESRSFECVRLLVAGGADVNRADAFGYTPLHLAALNEFSTCVGLLINAGADVMVRTNGGVSALTFVMRRTPDALPCFFERLDSSVTVRKRDLGDADCELRLDFSPLLPPAPAAARRRTLEGFYERRVESAMLLGFVEVGMRHMLKHPLCETFLFLKWRRIRKFFLFGLGYHSLFVALYTSYVLSSFSGNAGKIRNNGTECATDQDYGVEENRSDALILATGYALMAMNATSVAKEVFKIVHGWVQYAKNWENWLQCLIILSVFVIHGSGGGRAGCEAEFRHHVAALGVVLVWTDLMAQIGRFPSFGMYVQMFTTVSVNFSKLLLAYSCLLVGFGLALGVLLHNFPAFEHPHLSLLTAVIMMTGELEYENIFFNEDKEIPYKGTSHVVFLAFLILVTVILVNLLVGLAVSDIQGLQKTARLNRLVHEVELIAHLEGILFSRYLHRVLPAALLKLCLKRALLVSSAPYNGSIQLRPNDPRENRVPRHLLEAAYNLVFMRTGRKRFGHEKRSGVRRSSLYRSRATHNHFGSNGRSLSVAESDDSEEVETMAQQGQLLEFVSSQMSLLLDETEVRDSVFLEIQKRLGVVEKTVKSINSSDKRT